MNVIRIIVVLGLLLAAAFGCKPGPKSIDYGNESCAYCRMSIVDDRYAAQLVAKTGKTFSFDAAECMVHFKGENTRHEWAHQMLTDFTAPGKLIPAESAVILRSKELPSPMGMCLTAVGSKAEAKELQKQHGGKIYDYPQVVKDIDKFPAL